MRKSIAIVFFLFLCSSCHNTTSSQEAPIGNEKDTIAALGFTNSRTESPVLNLEWRLKQGEQDGPVQIVSCAINKKQELELKYRNVSADRIDVVRIVLLAYDQAGEQKDFAAGSPYQTITDQQELAHQQSAGVRIPLQDTQVSTVRAYVVKVHYASGGSWENSW
ncbi:MAG TPA: hypothetical protein VL092_09585 [Chitinophagaceae bacterium]|nr:hypothetical protein [Chitinophagaceae bacterium]